MIRIKLMAIITHLHLISQLNDNNKTIIFKKHLNEYPLKS
jgi:hypothetical protein